MPYKPTVADDTLLNTLLAKSIPFSTPNSPDYNSLRLPYNLRLQPKPAIIVTPQTPQQVSEAVTAAAQSGLKVQARSGGHSYASFSLGGRDGSMVIDLRELHDVVLLDEFQDPGTGALLKGVVAKVGGGTRLGNMARKIYELGGRALPHGTGASVGIGGHASLGGYGYVSRAWGLALDRIIAVDVVLADGTLVHANARENEDVFWAVRGAAHSIGVVVRFYMRTEEAPREVTYLEIGWDGMYEDKRRFTDTFLKIQEFSRDAGIVDERLSFGVRVYGSSYRATGGFLGSEEDLMQRVCTCPTETRRLTLTACRSCQHSSKICPPPLPPQSNPSPGWTSLPNVPTKATWTFRGQAQTNTNPSLPLR
jgi:FAD/FMN-containing dehydrogenase